jgi:hypothetical protein
MDSRTAARVLTLGRVAFGVALMAAPAKATTGWIGDVARRPGTQVPVTSLGARDIAIGVGGAWAVQGGDGAAPWLLAGAVADLADLAATLRHRDALPTSGVVGVSTLAAGAAAAGLWLAAELG